MVIVLPLLLALVFLVWARLVMLMVQAANKFSALVPAPAAESASAPAPSVTILIPARNEAERLEKCLCSVVAQQYPSE